MCLIDVGAALEIVDGPTASASGTNILRCFDVYDDSSLVDLRYAILSHRWHGEEVSFEVMNNLTKVKLQNDSGSKVVGSCKVAHDERIEWLWIDSCCIGVDTAERQEAINSMYQWY